MHFHSIKHVLIFVQATCADWVIQVLIFFFCVEQKNKKYLHRPAKPKDLIQQSM